MHINEKNLNRKSKISPRARRGIFIDYIDIKSQYFVYVLDKEKVKIFNICNVKFDEFIMDRSLLRNSDYGLYNLNLVRDLP
jgi:hypothetical protein